VKERGSCLQYRRSSKKARSILSLSSTPRTPRKRCEALEPFSPTPESGSPLFWVVGHGGFGTVNVLPKEIRQIIFAHTLDIDRPVTVKKCCGPNTTTRERDACWKHGFSKQTVGSRFAVLQVSKAISHESSWVLYNQGRLCIAVDEGVKPYLSKGHSRNLRHLSNTVQKTGRRTMIWMAAARFRFIRVWVPFDQHIWGDPEEFTGHLVEVACLLGKC
jgi:hypothetical protein